MLKLRLIISLATSVDVEHVFSHARIVIPHLQNQLSPKTVHRIMCVGAWSHEDLSDLKALKVLMAIKDD